MANCNLGTSKTPQSPILAVLIMKLNWQGHHCHHHGEYVQQWKRHQSRCKAVCMCLLVCSQPGSSLSWLAEGRTSWACVCAPHAHKMPGIIMYPPATGVWSSCSSRWITVKTVVLLLTRLFSAQQNDEEEEFSKVLVVVHRSIEATTTEKGLNHREAEQTPTGVHNEGAASRGDANHEVQVAGFNCS